MLLGMRPTPPLTKETLVNHFRLPATLALVATVALTAAGSPAQAHDGDRGGRDQHGYGHSGHGDGNGPWRSRGLRVTLTEDVTAALDAAGVEVEGDDGVRVDRNRDDLLVLSLGHDRRGHRSWGDKDDRDDRTSRRGGSRRDDDGSLTFSTDAASTTWSDFEVEKEDDVVHVTADVDGVEDVPVLALVKAEDDESDDGDKDGTGWHHRGGSRGWSAAELLLTEASAAALDTVAGAEAFAAGDVFATLGGCGR